MAGFVLIARCLPSAACPATVSLDGSKTANRCGRWSVATATANGTLPYTDVVEVS